MIPCETCNGKGYVHTVVYSHPTLPDGTERVEVCDECIDEAVNILMDEIVRPELGITDTVDSDLDDRVYSYVHNRVKAILIQATQKYMNR